MTGTCVYVIYLWQWLYFWFLPRPCAFKLLSHLFFCLFSSSIFLLSFTCPRTSACVPFSSLPFLLSIFFPFLGRLFSFSFHLFSCPRPSPPPFLTSYPNFPSLLFYLLFHFSFSFFPPIFCFHCSSLLRLLLFYLTSFVSPHRQFSLFLFLIFSFLILRREPLTYLAQSLRGHRVARKAWPRVSFCRSCLSVRRRAQSKQ